MSYTSYLPLVSERTVMNANNHKATPKIWTDENQHQRSKCCHCTFLRRFIAALSFLFLLTGLFAIIYDYTGRLSNRQSEALVPRDVNFGGIIGISKWLLVGRTPEQSFVFKLLPSVWRGFLPLDCSGLSLPRLEQEGHIRLLKLM
jgi:hypothetical protein